MYYQQKLYTTEKLREAYVSWAGQQLATRPTATEVKGPCPVCGGTDRFWINQTGSHCRHCKEQPGYPREWYKALLQELGLFNNLVGSSYTPIQESKTTIQLPPVISRAKSQKATHGNGHFNYDPVELWNISSLAPHTPAETYLREYRQCWPEHEPLPLSTRWIPRESYSRLKNSAGTGPNKYPELPPNSAGALLFVYVSSNGQPVGIGTVALSTLGRRIPFFWGKKRMKMITLGKKTGLFWCHLRRKDLQYDPPLHVAEGPVTAMAACTLATMSGQLGSVAAIATGGAHNLRTVHELITAQPVILHVDGERAGGIAARVAIRTLSEHGFSIKFRFYGAHKDAADAHAEQLSHKRRNQEK